MELQDITSISLICFCTVQAINYISKIGGYILLRSDIERAADYLEIRQASREITSLNLMLREARKITLLPWPLDILRTRKYKQSPDSNSLTLPQIIKEAEQKSNSSSKFRFLSETSF
ncbi:MAG: hypothetical protein AABX66_00010 [Nanoarchaeota archaeon]